MYEDIFERFTRLFDGAVDRRAAVKMVAGATLGSLLAGLLGCESSGGPEPPDGPEPPGGPEPPPELPRCVNPGSDEITGQSLRAARLRLTDGATEVSLSPGGCVRLVRTRRNDQVASDLVTVNGRRVLEWRFEGGGAVGAADADMDGFDEWTSVFTGGNGSDHTELTVEYDPLTRLVRRRRTVQRTGDTLHVVVEEDDGVMLRLVEEYDTSVYQHACGQSAGCQKPCEPPQNPVPCTSAECGQLREKMDNAAASLGYCMSEMLGDALAAADWQVMYVTASWLMPIRCGKPVDPQGRVVRARTTMTPWYVPVPPAIEVNEDIFCSYSSTCQQATLIHELYHAALSHTHNPQKERSCVAHQVDRAYACEWLCTNGSQNSTVCQCHVCKDSNRDQCDDDCLTGGFEGATALNTQGTANSNCCHRDTARGSLVLGWECEASKGWYETQQECAAGCGSSTCTPDEVKCNRY